MPHFTLFPLLETHTVPGWPEVYNPSLNDILLLTVALPVVIAVPVVLAVMGPAWLRRSQGTSSEVEPA
ncbi:MAG TPA: hypothetical protein PLK46_07465 [Propioniciclava sp.]|jgi:hypothetical protein|uniref:hypothetical protein n=1 Tax=Propioniciclava sp. TaxID=2038686 RepID=UPI002C383199|nr:hypothetical protein [Propioniciclava sp.]HRL50203.1 hypothetical protein [Propioniciclava sp.]HRL80153.1 hypothetical protein [Propioniciclava sp.]